MRCVMKLFCACRIFVLNQLFMYIKEKDIRRWVEIYYHLVVFIAMHRHVLLRYAQNCLCVSEMAKNLSAGFTLVMVAPGRVTSISSFRNIHPVELFATLHFVISLITCVFNV